MIELEFLKEQNVSESLIHGIEEFRKNYGAVSYTHLTLPTTSRV